MTESGRTTGRPLRIFLMVGVLGQMGLWLLSSLAAAAFSYRATLAWLPVVPGPYLALVLWGKPSRMEDFTPLFLGFVLNSIIYTLVWLSAGAIRNRWRSSTAGKPHVLELGLVQPPDPNDQESHHNQP